jgi:hypothetical protein
MQDGKIFNLKAPEGVPSTASLTSMPQEHTPPHKTSTTVTTRKSKADADNANAANTDTPPPPTQDTPVCKEDLARSHSIHHFLSFVDVHSFRTYILYFSTFTPLFEAALTQPLVSAALPTTAPVTSTPLPRPPPHPPPLSFPPSSRPCPSPPSRALLPTSLHCTLRVHILWRVMTLVPTTPAAPTAVISMRPTPKFFRSSLTRDGQSFRPPSRCKVMCGARVESVQPRVM